MVYYMKPRDKDDSGIDDGRMSSIAIGLAKQARSPFARTKKLHSPKE
jgi:hypothetical protein